MFRFAIRRTHTHTRCCTEKRLVKEASHGLDAWFAHYEKQFGARWRSSLYPALLTKNKAVGLMNPFFERFPLTPQLFHPRAAWCSDPELAGCICVEGEGDGAAESKLLQPSMLRQRRDVDAWLNEDDFRAMDSAWHRTRPDAHSTYFPFSDSANINCQRVLKLSWADLDPYYVMDAASVRIARLMRPFLSDGVCADFCASPGGKSLVMLSDMNEKARLVCNEMGFRRSDQLRAVLSSFVPAAQQQRQVTLSNLDAKLWGLAEPAKYDAVLLDAPCSADRHLLQQHSPQKATGSAWTLKQCRNLAKTQFALLRSALSALKVGGVVVYATCSLNAMENDEVVRQLLHRQKGRAELLEVALNVGERTECGWSILPDASPMSEGPLFVAKLRRVG